MFSTKYCFEKDTENDRSPYQSMHMDHYTLHTSDKICGKIKPFKMMCMQSVRVVDVFTVIIYIPEY